MVYRLSHHQRGVHNTDFNKAVYIFISLTFFRVNKTFWGRIILCILKHRTPGLTLLMLEHRPLQRDTLGVERDGGGRSL